MTLSPVRSVEAGGRESLLALQESDSPSRPAMQEARSIVSSVCSDSVSLNRTLESRPFLYSNSHTDCAVASRGEEQDRRMITRRQAVTTLTR